MIAGDRQAPFLVFLPCHLGTKTGTIGEHNDRPMPSRSLLTPLLNTGDWSVTDIEHAISIED